MERIQANLSQWLVMSVGPALDRFFGPFIEILSRRIVFSAMVIVFATFFQLIFAMRWSSKAVDPEIRTFDYKKRHHWRLYARMVGFLFLAWPYEEGFGYTNGYVAAAFLRGALEERWIIAFCVLMLPLVVAAIRRSVQYFRYLGAGFAMNLWFEYLKWMGYGMAVSQLWEALMRFIFDNFPDGLAYLLLIVSCIAQMVLIAGYIIEMIKWFSSSFLKDEYILELQRQERINRSKKRSGGGSGSTEDIVVGAKSLGADFPDVIYDSYENQYRLQSSSYDHADYYCSATGDSVQFWASDFEDGLPSGWRTGS